MAYCDLCLVTKLGIPIGLNHRPRQCLNVSLDRSEEGSGFERNGNGKMTRRVEIEPSESLETDCRVFLCPESAILISTLPFLSLPCWELISC